MMAILPYQVKVAVIDYILASHANIPTCTCVQCQDLPVRDIMCNFDLQPPARSIPDHSIVSIGYVFGFDHIYHTTLPIH